MAQLTNSHLNLSGNAINQGGAQGNENLPPLPAPLPIPQKGSSLAERSITDVTPVREDRPENRAEELICTPEEFKKLLFAGYQFKRLTNNNS